MGATNNSRTKRAEIKACPFCGCFAYIAEGSPREEFYLVQCINPKCHARLGKKYKSKNEAIKRWNKRTNITPGYWYRFSINDFVRCSCCHGVAADVTDIRGTQWWLSNYCPNCGAKMDAGLIEGKTLHEVRDNKERFDRNVKLSQGTRNNGV